MSNVQDRRIVLQLDDLGLTYPGLVPVEALRSCNLLVEAGDYVTIVGPSGSGKSSLLNVIGLLDRQTSGQYKLDGQETIDLGENERTSLRGQRIGFVFQSFHLIDHRTATENVMLGLLYRRVPLSARRERAEEILRKVNLGHRLAALPATMSGGERQRVAIARALIGEPALLLCDEPTGNLDSATSETVLELLDRLHNEGITILLITHDASVAGRGTRALTISDGRLSELSGARAVDQL